MSTATSLSSSASFLQLPVELRQEIFSLCVEGRNINLLYANKEVYAQLLPLLRNRFVLNLRLNGSISPSQIEILDSSGRSWGFRKSVLSVEAPHLHLNNNPLHQMPFNEFRKIVVQIDAPDIRDPGQIIRLHKLASTLVTILSRVSPPPSIPSLPAIEIVLRNTNGYQWHTPEQWNRSLPSYRADWDPASSSIHFPHGEDEDFDMDEGESDLEVVLFPFLRLRDAISLTITRPPGAPQLRFSTFYVKRLEIFSILDGDLGCTANERDGGQLEQEQQNQLQQRLGIDDNCLMYDSAMFLWLDYLLDDTTGPTADRLRAERIEHWCSGYESNLYFSTYGFNEYRYGAGSRALGANLVEALVAAFQSRYWASTILRRTLRYGIGVARKSQNQFWGEFPHSPRVMFTARGLTINGMPLMPHGPADACCVEEMNDENVSGIGFRGFPNVTGITSDHRLDVVDQVFDNVADLLEAFTVLG